jgi:hypothetical protein
MLAILDFETGEVHIHKDVPREKIEEFISQYKHSSIEWMYHEDMKLQLFETNN